MSRNRFIVFLTSSVLLLVLTLGAIVYYMNIPASLGEMAVSSDGVRILPFTKVLEYHTTQHNEKFRPSQMKEAESAAPTILFGKGGITVDFSKDTFDNFVFSMYDSQLTEIYADKNTYIDPENPGTYLVRVTFSWGRGKGNYIWTENFFKVKYNG